MTAEAPRRRRRPRTLIQLLVVAFVVHLFVIPQIGGARDAIDTISGVSPPLIAIAVALEAAAILIYARLTQFLLAVKPRPPLGICFGVALASMGINHVVPGGAATTAAVNLRLFGLAGVPGPTLGFALGTQAVGSAIVLNLILWIALLLSIPVSGFHAIYATAAAAGAILMMLFGLGIVGLLRGEDRVAHALVRAAKIARISDPERLDSTIARVAAQLRDLITDRRRLGVATGFAAANWLLDAAALWVFMAAFGHRPNPVGLLVAYGLANVLAAIPLTPGGLGVVEAVLIPTLIGFGSPASEVAVGVVAYRLVSFWLPIPAGLAAYAIVERRLTHTSERVGVQPVITDLMSGGSADQATGR